MAIHNFAQLNGASPGDQFASFQSALEKRNSPLQLHDPSNPDHSFYRSIAEEIVNISGADLVVYLRTNNSFDDVWEEDADPTYYPGVRIKGFFAPQPKATELTPWGVDTPNATKITFSRGSVLNQFGNRMIRIGDVIEIPYNALGEVKPDRYRVLNSADAGQFRYEWFYWECYVESITDDVTIDPDFAKSFDRRKM